MDSLILITQIIIHKKHNNIAMPNFANDPSRKSWLDS